MFSFTRRPAGSKTLVEYLLFLEAGAGEKKPGAGQNGPAPQHWYRVRHHDVFASTRVDSMMCLQCFGSGFQSLLDPDSDPGA